MHVAIASGKGGTGKTTLSVNLAAHLAQKDLAVTLADCDVEEPNAHIFLNPVWTWTKEAQAPVPSIDQARCIGESCRICVTECRFKALIWMGEIMDFPELCHGCGLCMEACPAGAISETYRTIGSVQYGNPAAMSLNNLRLVSGSLRVGEAMAPPLIRTLLSHATPMVPDEITLRDCPPGTSCPVITALEGATYTILVTEPTPFGLHDLRLAVETLRTLKQPFGVVINRDGMGDDRVDRWLATENIEILGRFAHSAEAAKVCAGGELLIDAMPQMRDAFENLWQRVLIAIEHTQHAAPEGGSHA